MLHFGAHRYFQMLSSTDSPFVLFVTEDTILLLFCRSSSSLMCPRFKPGSSGMQVRSDACLDKIYKRSRTDMLLRKKKITHNRNLVQIGTQ
jgi:hypothetical protein